MRDWIDLDCPYCGERIGLAVDASAGDHACVEDCQVCCRPIVVEVRVEDGTVRLSARREDEA